MSQIVTGHEYDVDLIPLSDHIHEPFQITGADPGGGGWGQDPSPPFWGTPKHHKEGKNETLYPPPEIYSMPILMAV